jgi:hypothetical protein
LRNNCHGVSGVKSRQLWVLRRRREAQPQSSLRRKLRARIVDAGQFHLQPKSPRQFRGFVAQCPAPSQRRVQVNLSIVDEVRYMTARKRLLGNPCRQYAEQNPTDARDASCSTKPCAIQQQNVGSNEKDSGNKSRHKPKMRSSQPSNRRTQAKSDTAAKSRGNRHGRKFHGARFNRTSVSM